MTRTSKARELNETTAKDIYARGNWAKTYRIEGINELHILFIQQFCEFRSERKNFCNTEKANKNQQLPTKTNFIFLRANTKKLINSHQLSSKVIIYSLSAKS